MHTAKEQLRIKALVRERDDQRCVECGMTKEEHKALYGKNLEVHRTEPGTPYTAEGCVTVCRLCHSAKPRSKAGEGNRDRIDLRAEREWIAKVVEEAKRLGLSLSAYVRLAVNECMGRKA